MLGTGGQTMNKNLTDNEIKKALECCVKSLSSDSCNECPLNTTKECDKDLLAIEKYALDLINRLQAENERLSKITRPLIAEIKSEAVKEFAERLKEKSFQSFGNYGITRDVVEVCDIDNLVKEIIEEDK